MNVGRNDPCPCGSGKKYKKCCIGKKNEIINSIPSNLPTSEPDGLISDSKLWALFHTDGKDPAKCTCADCADKKICEQDKTPEVCARDAKFEVGYG